MTPADYQALFARVHANVLRAAFEAGDLHDWQTVVALAERAVIGEGDQPGPGWVRNTLLAAGVRLPLAVAGDGDIEDAAGEPVIQIDPNRERRDDKVAIIAAVVALAINTCGGHAPRVEHQP
ncbi:hypothetical protein Q5H91_04015 [Sphingomonas sp. KR1UV-12]|uniref:Uncharacterized protein n=1 Tax=Sphingomonas aurea TaxID=3063994 RepID=A0ABT9EHB6_9SPHN|nr:hypothetical protein [Sphingomonas sp. KR1UV-12]MDP1026367.1 hypothetical protein [Sphingomonas sp. KR1UV-12]